METTVFNPVQQHLLKMFAWDNDEKSLLEVKEVLTRHFARKLDEQLDELWENGTLDQKRLDEIYKMHLHTDLK
jgi:hypothetical protein